MLVIFIVILIAPIIPSFHCFSQGFKTCWQQQPAAKQQLAYSLFHNQESFIYLHCHSYSPWELMETFFLLKWDKGSMSCPVWAPKSLCPLAIHITYTSSTGCIVNDIRPVTCTHIFRGCCSILKRRACSPFHHSLNWSFAVVLNWIRRIRNKNTFIYSIFHSKLLGHG